MADRSVGIRTSGADTYVAAFTAAEQAEGKERVVQLTGLTAGKVSENLANSIRTVISDDVYDATTFSGSIVIGDSAYLTCYLRHSRSDGECLVTPLLCDNYGIVMGCLDSQKSKVMLPVVSGTSYLSNNLSWAVMETGAWKVFVHVSGLSAANSVDLWAFTI